MMLNDLEISAQSLSFFSHKKESMRSREPTDANVFNGAYNMITRRKMLGSRMENDRRARPSKQRQTYTDDMFLSLLNLKYPTEGIKTEFERKQVILRAKKFNSMKSKNECLTDSQKKSLHKIMVAYDLYKEISVRF